MFLSELRSLTVRFLLFALLFSGYICLSVSSAYACSVCFSESTDLARYAYYGTTIGLIILPGGLVTAFVFWIRAAENKYTDQNSGQ